MKMSKAMAMYAMQFYDFDLIRIYHTYTHI